MVETPGSHRMQPFAGRRRRERSTVGRRPLGSVSTARSESEAEATGRRARAKAERAEGPLRARSAAPKGAAPRGRHSCAHPSVPVGSKTTPSSESYTKPWRPNSNTTSSTPQRLAEVVARAARRPALERRCARAKQPALVDDVPPAPFSLAHLSLPSIRCGRGPRPRPPVSSA